ncbi:hypothetical protein [Streptosporangium sp. KLBMP 9127]|nr:hypothetical protein [Streptosporangium sp. KLBMP 9127]
MTDFDGVLCSGLDGLNCAGRPARAALSVTVAENDSGGAPPKPTTPGHRHHTPGADGV